MHPHPRCYSVGVRKEKLVASRGSTSAVLLLACLLLAVCDFDIEGAGGSRGRVRVLPLRVELLEDHILLDDKLLVFLLVEFGLLKEILSGGGVASVGGEGHLSFLFSK